MRRVTHAPAGARAQNRANHIAWRDAAIVAARSEGDSVVEIARRFGLSKQRVSQILARLGPEDLRARSHSARAARQLAAAKARREQVLSAWRAGIGEHVIADRLGLHRGSVRAVLEVDASVADHSIRRGARLGGERGRTFSDRDLTDAIAAAVKRAGRVISQNEYTAIARELQLPSRSTIEGRLGSWNAALRAAGLTPPNAGRRSYPRRWTDQTCIEALRSLVHELGALPSGKRYRQLARERADLPSPSTLRKRVGLWSALTLRLVDESAEAPRAERTAAGRGRCAAEDG